MPGRGLIDIFEEAIDSDTFTVDITTKATLRAPITEKKDRRFHMRLPHATLVLMDKKRGNKSRSEFVRELIEQA